MTTDPLPSENTQAKTEDSGTVAAANAARTDPTNSAREAEEFYEGVSAELVDIDPDATMEKPVDPPPTSPVPAIAPPLPRSMRPKSAKDLASQPLGVTATLPAPVWPPRTVADLMVRKIFTVREDEPIGDLEKLMEKFRFGHLPVVGAQMKLVGLITRSDLLHAHLGKLPDGGLATQIDANTLAGTLMRKNVVFAKLDTSITTTAQVMLANKLPCIPIVLEDLTLVGIVTESDFVRLSLEFLGGKA